MAGNFNVKKISSYLETINDCKYSIEIKIVPLKEHILEATLFGNKHTTAKKITQKTVDCKFSCQNKCNTFKRMDDCHSSCNTERYTTSRDGWL